MEAALTAVRISTGDSTACTLRSTRPRSSKLSPRRPRSLQADPAAIVARKQRRPCVESGGVATTDAVAARIAAVIIARRVAPTCVRVIIAIVVIVVPRRGGGGDCGREQSVPGYRPPDCRRATPATLTGVDGRSTRASALSTPSETPRCSDQLNDSSATHATVDVATTVLFKTTFMIFSIASPHFKQCARDQPNGGAVASP